ncbi:hypothetical protein [Marinobacter algicola]|uniref:Uncharacterized protein n=1 Tax=Marinobacter algicola DG893 TaxID=443152 RepID=A6EUV9_9GAMM|nr:hypothetical protein [Marinobacter algicola]EDM49608.1 hypothetical protein MDG893_10421 [Marinobacter algicola DG893]
MNQSEPLRPSPKPHQAGEVEAFPTGRLTYLAPKPLPTGALPVDYGRAVGTVTGHYLDFGVGNSFAFAWQMVLGGPFLGFLMGAVFIPLLAFWGGFHFGNGWSDATWAFWDVMSLSFWIGLGGGLFVLLLGLQTRWQMHGRVEKIVPTRFNRQRREVCFVPEGHSEPIYIPWEELEAWVVEAQGVSEYGVRRQYGFGIGFRHPETGEQFNLEFETHGLPLSISNWEALRAYMEYEVHTLEEIQPHGELMASDEPQAPGAGPEEGVEFFHNARRNLHARRKAGKVGWIYVFFWYLYHVMTFWTIPNRLVVWENAKMRRLSQKALPESMEEWSQPLPESEWAQPSEKLKRQSRRVLELQKADPQKPATEIFAQVSEEFSGDASMTA